MLSLLHAPIYLPIYTNPGPVPMTNDQSESSTIPEKEPFENDGTIPLTIDHDHSNGTIYNSFFFYAQTISLHIDTCR